LSTISEEDVLNANFFAGGGAAAAAVRDENDGEEKASRTTRHVRDMFLMSLL